MKNLISFTMILLLTLSGCKKDKDKVDQIPLTLVNMTTLIGQSSGYIKDASPGEYDEGNSDADYLFFTCSDITSLGEILIGYSITSSKCDQIILATTSEELSDVDYLMGMAEDELGAGVTFYLSYLDDSAVTQEEEFDTYDELWSFIEDYGIQVDDIDGMIALYPYDDILVTVAGVWSLGYFVPSVLISPYDSSKKSTSPAKYKKAVIEQIQNFEHISK